jgi:hypothetical protein
MKTFGEIISICVTTDKKFHFGHMKIVYDVI